MGKKGGDRRGRRRGGRRRGGRRGREEEKEGGMLFPRPGLRCHLGCSRGINLALHPLPYIRRKRGLESNDITQRKEREKKRASIKRPLGVISHRLLHFSWSRWNDSTSLPSREKKNIFLTLKKSSIEQSIILIHRLLKTVFNVVMGNFVEKNKKKKERGLSVAILEPWSLLPTRGIP